VSRALCFFALALLAGCATSAMPPEKVVVPAAPAVAPSCARNDKPAASAVATCTDRFAFSDDLAGANVNALLFEGCDRFLPSFLDAVRSSCGEATPELVKAIVAEQTARMQPDFARRTSDAAYLALARASRPFVPAGCAKSFPTEDEDVGRQIFEIKRDWRECYPDPELLLAFTHDLGAMVTYSSASIIAAEYYWAVAMAPHMTPVGKQFLRKFLVCGQFQAPPSFIEQWPESQYPYGDLPDDSPAEPTIPKPPVSRHPPKR
jgi:hypothetical protein